MDPFPTMRPCGACLKPHCRRLPRIDRFFNGRGPLVFIDRTHPRPRLRLLCWAPSPALFISRSGSSASPPSCALSGPPTGPQPHRYFRGTFPFTVDGVMLRPQHPRSTVPQRRARSCIAAEACCRNSVSAARLWVSVQGLGSHRESVEGSRLGALDAGAGSHWYAMRISMSPS